jgi:acyl-CoA thioester hydrolase
MENDIAQYPVVIEQNVTWGDMDAHGHVNNVEYFRYMENARIEYYLRIEKYEFEREAGITLVLKDTNCRFISSLAHPDRIAIGARVKEIANSRMIMTYIIMNILQNRVAALGEATIVALNAKDNTKVLIPDELKRRIQNLQQKNPPSLVPGEHGA